MWWKMHGLPLSQRIFRKPIVHPSRSEMASNQEKSAAGDASYINRSYCPKVWWNVSLLVCDLNRTPNCYGKTWRFLCIFFSGISTCGRTSRETVSYLVIYNTSPPRMFLSLDLLWEYWIQHGANGPLYVTFSCSIWIFCRGVSGFATDCPCGVWCRGLTICLLHVGQPFGNRILNNSSAVGLT